MWESTTDRLVRINGGWFRASAVNAIEPKTDHARIHLDGTTVDVPLRDGQTVDTIARALTKGTP